MKYSNSIFLVFTAAFFLLCQGCKKDKDVCVDQWSLSDNALSYIKMEQGKYLVYKDSATTQEDSVIVTKSDLYNTFVPGNNSLIDYPNHNYESYDLQLTKFDGSGQTLWLAGKADANKGYYSSIDTVYVFMVDEIDHFAIFQGSESSHSNLSMIVEGKNYDNVVEYIGTNGYDSTDPAFRKSICYWAKLRGLIKRTTISGSSIKTYTLLRNN
ncbi:MAG: hypothetical protein ABI402_03305 [Ferruginibacter sp.]